MKAAILTRLKRLEEVQATENLLLVEFQVGYLKSLPAEYAGECHFLTVGRDPDGLYHWEERPGPAPQNECRGILPPFRVVLASPEDAPRAQIGRLEAAQHQ